MQMPIDEEFLQQVEALELLIRNNTAGMFGGNHRSKTYGSSCEFADYRDYIPGDDITKIDWNTYARFEKLYLKLFLDERQMHTRIYIDVSRSMAHGKNKKDTQAIRVAATLAYLSVHAMDKVSIYTIRDRVCDCLIRGMLGKDAYIASIGKLNEIEFSGDSYISESILPTTVGYGDGLSVIVSDFLTDNDYTDAITHLATKRRDILCVQVLSPEELNPKARGKMHFFDSEDGSREYRKNINRDIIAAYKMALEYATGKVEDACNAVGAEYLLVPSDEPVTKLFFDRLVQKGVLK